MSVLHGSYTLVGRLGLRGLEVLGVTITSFLTNRPFHKARDGRSSRWSPPCGQMWTFHPTSWFCQETVEGEEGAPRLLVSVWAGRWSQPQPACKELGTLKTDYFTLQQMNTAFVNSACWGGPLLSGFQNCFVMDSDRYSEIAKHWLLELKCFMQIKDAFLSLPPTVFPHPHPNLNTSVSYYLLGRKKVLDSHVISFRCHNCVWGWGWQGATFLLVHWLPRVKSKLFTHFLLGILLRVYDNISESA